MLRDWVKEANLRQFVEFASQRVGYDFDDDDWSAIEVGLEHTDVEKEHWFEYPLDGAERASIGIARDSDSSVVFVRADTAAAVEDALNIAVELMQRYEMA